MTLALGFDDCMNTAREMLACAPTVTSSDVCKLNCSSEACPRGSSWPFARAGWFAMEIRKVLCAVVVFRKVTVNARCRSCDGLLGSNPSGFAFPSDPTTSPGATIDV